MRGGVPILVTGGAGYVGSHIVLALLDAGFPVVVVDDLSTGCRALIPPSVPFFSGNAADSALVASILDEQDCQAVIHCAGSTIVEDSVRDPLAYYRNNTEVSRSLLATCLECSVDAVIFSSSAAVYGEPATIPVTEDMPTAPLNPYGASKLMTERMLRDIAAVSSLRYIALRYFNVAGADPLGRVGQTTPRATQLFRVACEVASGKRSGMTIFGTDYDTPDGTCIRDFIHVSDLATAHVAAIRYLLEGGGSQILNCGYGHGFSVREVLSAVERASGTTIAARPGPRRPGDPSTMVAASDRLRRVLRWAPRHDDLDEIAASTLAWELRPVPA